MPKKNVYTHEIELTDLHIKNAPKEVFSKRIEKIKYRGYRVESISDGREIVITKPGGKYTRGPIKREDFMVFVFSPASKTLWLISHNDIYNDLLEKGNHNPQQTIEIIAALQEVFNGAEPEDLLATKNLDSPIGENPEVLLKAYKWIWGQEDVNYPTGEGRARSFNNILKLKSKLEQAKSP
ncbi:MAG: hypothetical protein R6U37_05150 [Dehalococcoidia bacterium]